MVDSFYRRQYRRRVNERGKTMAQHNLAYSIANGKLSVVVDIKKDSGYLSDKGNFVLATTGGTIRLADDTFFTMSVWQRLAPPPNAAANGGKGKVIINRETATRQVLGIPA